LTQIARFHRIPVAPDKLRREFGPPVTRLGEPATFGDQRSCWPRTSRIALSGRSYVPPAVVLMEMVDGEAEDGAAPTDGTPAGGGAPGQ
jgi:hypothetical protein